MSFYFCAQTGVIQRDLPKVPSNFYYYKLPDRCLAKIQLLIQKAYVTDCGLEYDKPFLEWLKENEQKYKQP